MDEHTLTAPSDISAGACVVWPVGRMRHIRRCGRCGKWDTRAYRGVNRAARRGGGEMSVRGFTLVSVISPGVTTRAPSGCGGIPHAQGKLALVGPALGELA